MPHQNQFVPLLENTESSGGTVSKPKINLKNQQLLIRLIKIKITNCRLIQLIHKLPSSMTEDNWFHLSLIPKIHTNWRIFWRRHLEWWNPNPSHHPDQILDLIIVETPMRTTAMISILQVRRICVIWLCNSTRLNVIIWYNFVIMHCIIYEFMYTIHLYYHRTLYPVFNTSYMY